MLKYLFSYTKDEEGADRPDIIFGGSDMVLLNPASYRGYNGQEIRTDLRADQAAKLNNPGPDRRVTQAGRGGGSNPANLGLSARNDSLLETIEAIRARLREENRYLQEMVRKARENRDPVYSALERMRSEETPGQLVDEFG